MNFSKTEVENNFDHLIILYSCGNCVLYDNDTCQIYKVSSVPYLGPTFDSTMR